MRVGREVLLGLVLFSVSVAVVEARPSVSIYADRDAYSAGDTIEVSLSGGNPGEGISVAVYLGLLTPDGFIYTFEPGGWGRSLQPWIMDVYLPFGFNLEPTTLWWFALPCSEPPISAQGPYSFASVLTRSWSLEWVSELSFAQFWVGEASGFHGGDVTGDMTISGDIELTRDVVIRGGGVLTILPPSRIRLGKDVGILVYGGLVAEADRDGSIVFERLRPDEAWENITFGETASEEHCRLVRCKIQGGTGTYCDDYLCGGAVLCDESSPWIEGNTIVNNWAEYGGGIYCCENSSPTIVNNTVTGNSVGWDGGGIYCSVSSPSISNNTISDNTAGGDGGGIYCRESSPNISDNTISDNSADREGGGVVCRYSSSPTVANNTITGNSAGWDGGGIYCSESSPSISNNTISGNSAGGEGGGGGIDCYYYSSPTITDNTIADNWARYGGGINCQDSWTTIENNTITGNSGECGAGISCHQCSPAIQNNVIGSNMATEYGGGLFFSFAAFPNVQNNLVVANRAASGGGIFSYERPAVQQKSTVICNNTFVSNRAELGGGIYCEDRTATILDCILWGNGDELYGCSATYCCIEDNDLGEGDILEDPMFVSGWFGDYYLDPGSPCIDAGSRFAAEAGLSGVTTQADGTPDTGRVDIGYHYPIR